MHLHKMDNNGPINTDEKDKFLNDLKKSINELPLLARTLFKGLQILIEKKYDSLPPSKKLKLIELGIKLKLAKSAGTGVAKDLYDKFQEIFKKKDINQN